MNKLFQLLGNEIIYAMGWAIIHSLWQCTLIALLIAISYAFTKKASAATRYWINSVGLLSCFIASCITFYINYYDAASIEIPGSEHIIDLTPSLQQPYMHTLSEIINQHINQIVTMWLIGFILYISKYITEFFYCQHIKNHHYKKPGLQLQQVFNELKNSVGITRKIQLRISEIMDVPCVIGHFKPVVLLPASLVLGLSVRQIEMIFLHELGHVRRNDYLINGLQSCITVFYFFNPFARWISAKMDEERENACDDIAVSVSGDALFYANTLKEFAEMKNNYSPAVAMIGRKTLLISRIKRLFIRDASFSKTYGKVITIMAILLPIIGYSVAGYSEEKKPTNDIFNIKLENEPLSNLVKLVEGYCQNTQGKIKLKHPDQLITGNFPDLECNTAENVIRGMDNSLNSTLTGISISEKDIALKNLATKLEAYCPETKGKIVLSNPEVMVSFKTENLNCFSVEPAIKSMDKNEKGQSTTIASVNKIEYKEPSEYEKAFYKELSFPKDIVDMGYTGDCTVTFMVDTSGVAKDIHPVCTSTNDEQKKYFEKLINDVTQKVIFPIKMENGKAVLAKGITIKTAWKRANTTEKPMSSDTLPKKESPVSNIDAKTIKIERDTKEDDENNDFSVGLSINKDININDYKEIEFKPLFFGKKLIDAKNSFDYTYTQKEFDYFNSELIGLLNRNLFTAIRHNKLNFLANTTGSKKLIGEVYVHKIIPYWQKDLIPFSSSSGSFSLGTAELNHFPFKARILIGVTLKDADSKEIVAVLKDQFSYSESKTGISYMSEKRKSRFVNENIISYIQESIIKISEGLVVYNQQKLPSPEPAYHDQNFLSKI